MNNFKVGDRVIVTGVTPYGSFAGCEGVIIRASEFHDWLVNVTFPDGNHDELSYAASELAHAQSTAGEGFPHHLTITLTDEQRELLSRILEKRFRQIEIEEHDHAMNITRELANYGLLEFSHNAFTHKYTVRSSGAAELMLKGVDVIADLRTQLAQAQAARDAYKAALEPFAEAWLQVPCGLASTLRVWNGRYGDEAKYPILGISTDDLESAHTAYFGLQASTPAGGEAG